MKFYFTVCLLLVLFLLPSQSFAAVLTKPLKLGDTGNEVTILQQGLQKLGFYTYPTITGLFGPITEKSVQLFQSAYSIVTSGTAATTGYGAVGPKTLAVFNGLQGQTTSGIPVVTVPVVSAPALVLPALTRDLWLNQTGADVKTLQTFLKIKGFYTYPEITGFYGPATKAAVAAFQAKNGVPALGGIGPDTRRLVNLEMQKLVAASGTSGTPGATGTVVVPTPTGTSGTTVVTNGNTVPAAPTSLKVDSARSTAIALSWKAVTGATSYTLKRMAKAESSYSVIASGITTTSYKDISVKSGTTYTYIVTASNAYGESVPSNSVTASAKSSGGGGGGGGGSSADSTSPTISMTAPANSATVSGASVSVTATASDNVGVAGVQFKLDGTNLSSEDTSSPYAITWDSTAVIDGAHTLTAVARDAAGNYATATAVSVTVDNSVPADVTVPTVSLTAPANSATISGSSVTVSATASDNVAVSGVRFVAGNTTIGVEDTSSPYSVSFNSTGVGDGALTLKAVARDAAGNYATSTISVTVDNTAPVISSIASSTGNTTATITWTTDESANSQVLYGTTIALGSTTTLDSSMVTSHTVPISGLASSTQYYFKVRSVDASGNIRLSAVNTFLTTTAADLTAPSVSLTAPANAATISGSSVTVSATASDNVAVSGVRFVAGNTTIGVEDTSSPYSVSFDSTGVSNGALTLKAVARDAAGNYATSTISVTVSNADVTVPTVSLTAPANAATISGAAVTVSATASDNIGVVGVRFVAGNTTIGVEDTSSPYAVSFDSTGVSNGALTLKAVARDAAGNYATSTISVTVSNADVTVPTVSMTAPANSATVSGASVSVTATASDNVGVAGVQFKLDGTNLSSEDTSSPYAITWDSTAVIDGAHTLTAVARDAAGNYATATAVSVTVSNGGASIVLNDQSLSFGRLTIAAAGGVAPTTASGTISYASITSGNASGHWQIAADGTITPTVTGDTADLNAGPYTLGVAVSDGVATDTASITITTNALTYDVRSTSELEAAVGAAETRDNTADYTIYVRDDATLLGGVSDNINILGITMQGSLVDPNEGANEAAFDYNATASFTGGSIEIGARTAYAPEINGKLNILGSTGIKVSGLTFTRVPTSDSYSHASSSFDETAAVTTYQAYVSKNGSYPAESTVIFANNHFGGKNVNNNPRRWGVGVRFDIAGTAILEDNDFNGVYAATTFASARRGVARRNTIENQVVDGIRAMGNASADLTSFTSQRVELSSNTCWQVSSSSEWAAAHSDCIQIGTTLDQVPYDIFVKKNYAYMSTYPTTYPPYTDDRATQGIYLDDTGAGVPINGLIAENFIVTKASAGINAWYGTLEIRNNTLVKDLLYPPSSGNVSGGSVIRVANGTGHSIHDNIVDSISNTAGTYTAHDNYTITYTLSSGSSASYYDSFDGPFTPGTYGPTWSATQSSAAALRASLDSIFAPKTGSLSVGRGHTNTEPDRTPAALSFTNLTNQATNTLVYANQQVTGITDGTFVVPTGVSWGVANTNDYNDVVTWNTGNGSIDNNQYLHIRMQSSAAGYSTSTGSIAVGTASASWSVTTGAGGYVATAIEFDGTNDGLTTSAFTGSASKQGLLSLWLYYNDTAWATSSRRLFELRNTAGSARVDLFAATTGRLTLTVKNSANTNILNYTTPSSTFSPRTWYNLLIAYDLASSTFQVYKNSTSVSVASAVMSNDTAEAQTKAGVGSNSAGTSKWKGYVADVFYNPTYADISSSTVRQKFISAGGKPVDLGASGSTPLGVQPTVYLSGAFSSWHTNKGTGGGFTVTGAINATSSSPSN